MVERLSRRDVVRARIWVATVAKIRCHAVRITARRRTLVGSRGTTGDGTNDILQRIG